VANVLAILTIFAILFAVVQLVGKLKFHRIARARHGGDLRRFEARMRELGVDDHIGTELVTFLRKWTRTEDFEVRPDDDLLQIYGLADEDVADALAEIGVSCGRAPQIDSPLLKQPILVEDFALVLAQSAIMPTAAKQSRP
jgi:hypothetical protein